MTDPARLAVVPGSFDPVTNGHVDIVLRASRVFDRVLVAVLTHPAKTGAFSVDERVRLLRQTFAGQTGIEVDTFGGLLVDYARARGAAAIVRGLRRSADFDYEMPMAQMNRHLAADIETVFLVPSPAVAHISSTLVRDILSHGGPVDGLVPSAVAEAVRSRRDSATRQRV